MSQSSSTSGVLLQFLQKMINDRAENVEAVQQIAAEISGQTDATEKQQVRSEIKDLIARCDKLKHKVDDRSRALDENLGMLRFFGMLDIRYML